MDPQYKDLIDCIKDPVHIALLGAGVAYVLTPVYLAYRDYQKQKQSKLEKETKGGEQ